MAGFLKVSDSIKSLFLKILVTSFFLILSVFLAVHFIEYGTISEENQVLKFRNIDTPLRLFFNGKTGNLFNLFWTGSSGALFFITLILCSKKLIRNKWFIFFFSSHFFFWCVIFFYGFFNERYYLSLFLVQIITMIIILKKEIEPYFVKLFSIFICINLLLYSFFYFRLNISVSKTITNQFVTATISNSSCSKVKFLDGAILNNNIPEFYAVSDKSIYANISTAEIYTRDGVVDLKPYKADVNIFTTYLIKKFNVKYIVSSEHMDRIDPFFKNFLLTKTSLMCKTNMYSLYIIN